MKSLFDEINSKCSDRIILTDVINNITKKIKKIDTKIENIQKSILLKVIKIISFNYFNYKNIYDKIILRYKQKSNILKNNLEKKNEELENINNQISLLENKFKSKINLFKKQLLKFQSELIYVAQNRYINNYTQVQLINELTTIVLNKEKFLFDQDIKNFIPELLNFYNQPEEWVNIKNNIFIKNEKIKEKKFFDTIESNPLTEKQQEAVLINENNNLILAGAGSGKTSVIIAKVSYLIKKKILHPSEILILAFNKNAQEELKRRFAEKNIHIQIKTFHSFGLSIVSETQFYKPELCSITESTVNMNKFIKDIIKKLMESEESFFEKYTKYLVYFSIPYKSENDFSNSGEYYEYQKNYDMKTLKHEIEVKSEFNKKILATLKEETVKSYQELMIANFLTLNSIRYLYEEPYKYKTNTKKRRQYKPDFYLPDYDIYIEHYGIDRNGKTAHYVNNIEYMESIKWKRKLHSERGTIVVETFSYEFTENNLLENLKNKLLKYNVVFKQLTKNELLELLRESIDDMKFTKLFATFLQHYKANMHSLDNLKRKSRGDKRTILFLELFEFVFNEYKRFQEEKKCIDFNDMIVKAFNGIKEGRYKNIYKHIFVDEFQDISTTRAKLLTSLNNISITAVGDDWQSINRFAGSNIKIIQKFEKIFGITKVITLDYTFRFNNAVSEIASDFIQKNPYQLRKEIKTIKKQNLNQYSILLYWTNNNNKDSLEDILKLISRKEKKSNKTIMVLARYNFLFEGLKSLRDKYKNFNIIFSTIHSSKGNEADYIVVLSLNSGKFGFPSKIENDPILDIVIPEGDEFENAEERRLFYVALTRTKETIFLLSNMYEQSDFIKELISENKNKIFFLNELKTQLSCCPECKTGFLIKRQKNNDNDECFYGCSNFPRCKYTENIHYCPKCKSEVLKNMEAKIARCSNDNCNFETKLCIKCGGYLIRRNGEYGAFLACENYPMCTYTKKI